jgi:hypothetical protein
MTSPTHLPNLVSDDGDSLGYDIERLIVLLRLVEGAWALARFEDGAVRQQVIGELRAALAPLPVAVPLTRSRFCAACQSPPATPRR